MAVDTNSHYLTLLITNGGGIVAILTVIWRGGSKFITRFEAVETGLKEVKEEQGRQARKQRKIAKKVKRMQVDATAEVREQHLERQRVQKREKGR
jgi:hypothetical protein